MDQDLGGISKDIAILLVDDVPSARRVVKRMLSALQLNNITEVGGVVDALKYLESSPVSLVISDVHLKDGLGMDILIQWMEKKPEKDIPFIFITSDMEKETFKKAVDLGAHYYLLKPFSQANLVSKMREAFNQA